MLFTQIEFFVFLTTVIAFVRFVRNHRAQKVFLLLASYYFYAYWDWRFLGLLLLSTIIDFLVGQGLKRTKQPSNRKALIIISVIVNLALLATFKYCNFFVSTFRPLLAPFGFNVGAIDIILPIGISFYTFQSLSYVIDVYRGTLKPCDRLLDYAVFVAFFPQLLAGPIVRASHLLPQFAAPRVMTWERTFLGFRQFVYGLVKKAIVADSLASFVDVTFANAGAFDSATTWLSVLAYSLQIYCDFSGYSDMAIGTARVLGYDFTENFRCPYIARSIDDFWRRWHISLSSWLRDYLYIPLGGNRKGELRTYVNLMLTMLLGGLWHGAAWTFVFWGGLHGASLAVHKLICRVTGQNRDAPRGTARAVWGWAVTMLIVVVGWVFFRAHNYGDAFSILRQMFLPEAGLSWIPPLVLTLIGLMAAVFLVHALNAGALFEFAPDRWYTPAILFFLLWTVVVFRPKGFTPFIYFQF